MADPLDYTLVRMDNNIHDKAVLSYDAINDKITDSGLHASQGELQASAGTISVGLQDMSSAGEQVVWRNQNSHVTYAPPWHIVDEVNTEGSRDRIYGDLNTKTRYAIRTDVLENPVFDVYIPTNEVVFRLKMTFPEAHKDVEFKVTNAGYEMWREIKDVSAGANEIVLDIPIAFYSGSFEFSIKPYAHEGISVDTLPSVKVMGDAQTGKVGYDVVYREFREIPLATKEYVDSVATGGDTTDFMLKSVYDTDDDGKVNLAVAADRAASLTGVQGIGSLHYYGKDANGHVGFHPLPTGGSLDLTQLSSGDIPTWDATDKTFVPSGIRKVVGQVIAEPSGIYLGDVNLATDSTGVLISPVSDPKTYRVLSQAITAGSDVAYIRKYGAAQDNVVHAAYATDVVDPSVAFQSDKDVTLLAMDVKLTNALKELTVTFTNTEGDNIWKESFFNLDAGDNTLTLSTPPDLLSGTTVTLNFRGESHTDSHVTFKGRDANPYLSLSMTPWVEEKISTEDYVSQGIEPIENRIDDAEKSIDTTRAQLTALKDKVASVHNYFVFRGKSVPTFPTELQSGYFVSLYALTQREDLVLPKVDNMRDGTLFFLANEDTDNSVFVKPGAGDTVKGGSLINVPPSNILWLVRSGNDWNELLSGYLPSSYQTLISDIQKALKADTSFLRSLGVQGDDPNATPLEVSKLAFTGCDVEHDVNDPKMAHIQPRLGVDFINPDGSRVNKVTEVKLVGMEIKAMTDGTPPKLILLDHNNNPQPSTASAYAFFDASPTVSDSVPFQSLPVFRGGRVTVHKDNTAPQYAYILIPPGEATDAERIGELGGIPTYWTKQSKDYNVGGQQRTYTVFRSPYPFHEKDVTLVIYP